MKISDTQPTTTLDNFDFPTTPPTPHRVTKIRSWPFKGHWSNNTLEKEEEEEEEKEMATRNPGQVKMTEERETTHNMEEEPMPKNEKKVKEQQRKANA